jgi:hypothetical protein
MWTSLNGQFFDSLEKLNYFNFKKLKEGDNANYWDKRCGKGFCLQMAR